MVRLIRSKYWIAKVKTLVMAVINSCFFFVHTLFTKKTKKNAIVEYLDYQIPITQLKGQKGKGDMQAVK